MARILSKAADIRAWAEARGGSPMLEDVPDPTGDRTLLELSFGQHMLNADSNEGPDRATGGFRLVSWDEWLEELDKQRLALKVNDETPGALDNDFRFVARGGDGKTTAAAQQPAPGSVERPRPADEDEDDVTVSVDGFRPAPGEGGGSVR
jgi:hypothetical protein